MRNVVQLCMAANNVLLMRKRNHVWYVLAWKKADRFASRRYSLKNKLGDRMIKQLLNSVITKYRDLPVSRTSIICLSLRLRQIIDLLATDKSRYFAQPHPILVNFSYTDDLRENMGKNAKHPLPADLRREKLVIPLIPLLSYTVTYGRMGTSFGRSDFWGSLGGQALVRIVRWYSRQQLDKYE